MWSHANSLFCAVIIQPLLCTTSTWLIRKDISNVQMYFWKHSKNSHVLGSSSLDWQNSLWVCFKKWDVLCCGCVSFLRSLLTEGSRDEVGYPTQNTQNQVWKARELRECICFFPLAADVLIFPFIKNVQPCVGNVLLLICQTSKHWHVLNNVEKKKKGHLDICSEDKCGVSVWLLDSQCKWLVVVIQVVTPIMGQWTL